ncbi:MAG: hypothetical protein P8R42_06730 [Candidatus Binatia bacterium]|nr:hypothetical protein [Candidatus Binatia bacterium]
MSEAVILTPADHRPALDAIGTKVIVLADGKHRFSVPRMAIEPGRLGWKRRAR